MFTTNWCQVAQQACNQGPPELANKSQADGKQNRGSVKGQRPEVRLVRSRAGLSGFESQLCLLLAL